MSILFDQWMIMSWEEGSAFDSTRELHHYSASNGRTIIRSCSSSCKQHRLLYNNQLSNLLLSSWLLWVRSISFPGSTLVCPRCVRIALMSFQGLTRLSPKCLACGMVTWGWPEVHDVTTRGQVIVRLALVRGSPVWAPQSRHGEANRMHPLSAI